MATDEFFNDIALPQVLKWEGGYVNNPDDKGGATNRGITQQTYNSYRRSHEQPMRDVKLITIAEVTQIYKNNYWLAAGCEKMSDKFALLVFDTAVNMGISRAKEFLKAAQWKYPEKFIAARRAKYEEFAKYGNQKIFLKGWLNRLNDLERVVNML